jgi:hypothetical protein
MPIVLQGNFRDSCETELCCKFQNSKKKRITERERERSLFVCMYEKKSKRERGIMLIVWGMELRALGVCLQRENKSILNRLLPLGN